MPPQTTRKRQKSYHHGDLREALLSAALKAATERGPESVTISALARELGVTAAAPYRHFADRDALLADVGERGFRACSALMRGALARDDGRSTLGRLAHAYKDFGLSQPGLYELMFASGIMAGCPEDAPLKLAAKECFELAVSGFDSGLDDCERLRIVLRFWAAVHGIVTLVKHGLLAGEGSEVTVDELVDGVVRDIELAAQRARIPAAVG
jgi:AcrR family transcriptional regulator